MKVKKLLIGFRSGTSAFERNSLVRNVMAKIGFQDIVSGTLIDSRGNQSKEYFEDAMIEKAVRIEIHYV